MAPVVFRNWLAWPLPKIGIGIILELRSGVRFVVRPGTHDLGVINEAFILNPYLSSGHIKLPLNAVVVDVGANIGDFSVHAAALCPEGKVYAVEPLSTNADMISINKTINGLSNLQIVQVALGAEEGQAVIASRGSQSSIHWRREGASSEQVRVTTLCRMMAEYKIDHIDLLKLDCEGAEWDILPNSVEAFSKITQICMEYHLARGWTVEKLASFLSSHGYEVKHTNGEWNGLLWATRRE